MHGSVSGPSVSLLCGLISEWNIGIVIEGSCLIELDAVWKLGESTLLEKSFTKKMEIGSDLALAIVLHVLRSQITLRYPVAT
jgi:hypothetical protein